MWLLPPSLELFIRRWRECAILVLLGLLYWSQSSADYWKEAYLSRPEEKEVFAFDEHLVMRRGPGRTTKKKETKPDGTVVEETVEETGPSEASKDTSLDATRESKPAAVAARERKRFIGLELSPRAWNQLLTHETVRGVQGGFLTDLFIFEAGLRRDGGKLEISYRF